MADNYYFELNDGNVTVVVVDEIGPINTWHSLPENNCLIVESGIVNSNSDSFICHSGPPNNEKIVTLFDASWNSQVGDTGSTEAHLAQGCSPDNWTLVKKD